VLTAPYAKHVIVVDDGSTDGTGAILSGWEQQAFVEVCRHDRNRGKGRAIRTALERARGRYVIVQDGDLETDPQDYGRLIEPLLLGHADFVIGSRFTACGGARTRANFMFRVGVRIMNLAVWLLYRVRVSDEACCYKILATETLKVMDLQCERFEFCPEVVAKASRMRLRMTEVAIRYSPRTTATGKKLRYRDGFCALWWLWRLRNWNPGPMRFLDAAAT
jgi:glycosyltransferase involved in cell wall biosynthesis